MHVRLMLTCLCDAYFGEVGIATVRVLEHAGCTVEFPESQTCCGQPPFNSGDRSAAKTSMSHWLSAFKGEDPVVTPSASCAAMVREGFETLQAPHDRAQTYELAEFLVRELGLDSWPGAQPYRKKIAFHRACHGRGLNLRDEQERLLASIPEIELVPINHFEQCCGFGGAFSVTEGRLSSSIGLEKLERVLATGAEELVSGDMGCLMHLRGLIDRHKLPLRTRHFAEILAETIP